MSELLIKLAKRCEKATEPNHGLDCDIGKALAGPSGNYSCRPYTSSLDAAMLLVPEGMVCAVTNCDLDRVSSGPDFTKALAVVGNPNDDRGPSEAVTAPLALCAASLRARAASAIRTATGNTDAVHESATAEGGDAQTVSPSNPPEKETRGQA